MARAPRKAAEVVQRAPTEPASVALKDVDPEKHYYIKISRNVRVGNTVLRPFDKNAVKGKHIAAMGDAVTSIEPLD